MRVVAIVQARVMSTRLPAKVLLDLGGVTALERCVVRARRIAGVDEVCVATSTRPEDDLVVSLGKRLGLRVSRGSETDVVSRYAHAARETGADSVVRITADCPLLDPAVSAAVVRAFLESRSGERPLDYASNTLVRKLPRGLDTEIMSMGALEAADAHARGDEREHVTMHLYRNPERFALGTALPPGLGSIDYSHYRWTLDTIDDYRFLARVFELLGPDGNAASMADVVSLLEREPALASINAHVEQKA